MSKPAETEFMDQYVGPIARRVSRELYRALYPTGMQTNGPCRVQVEASHLYRLLDNFKKKQDA